MRFRRAETIEEALDSLAALGDDAHVLAGGTDLMVQYLRGELAPDTLVHIQRIESLGRITENGALSVGALVTHRKLAVDPAIRRLLPGLAEAAATVGGRQTQEVGTIGGNVCNASPAADTVPPLLVAGATVHLASSSGERALPLDDFLLGRRHTARRPDELVTSFEMDLPAPRSGEVYLKVGPRGGMEVALVGLAARLSFDPDGETVAEARIAATAVAPHPFRAVAAETVLAGRRLEAGAIADAGRLLAEAADPIDDQRATATYRRRVLAPLLARAVDLCRRRALGA